jgi:hypothetical protein
METLRKTVRKKLVEKKNYKKNILQEEKIIKTRLKLLVERNSFDTKEDQIKFADDLINEIIFINKQGLNKTLINEEGGFNVFGWLQGFLGKTPGGFIDTVVERIADWIMDQLNVPDNMLRRAIRVYLANNWRTPTKILKLFSDCEHAVQGVTDALVEAYIDKFVDAKFGDNMFYDSIRNAIVSQFRDGKFDEVINGVLINVLCPLLKGSLPKWDNIVNTMKGGAMSALSGAKPDKA